MRSLMELAMRRVRVGPRGSLSPKLMGWSAALSSRSTHPPLVSFTPRPAGPANPCSRMDRPASPTASVMNPPLIPWVTARLFTSASEPTTKMLAAPDWRIRRRVMATSAVGVLVKTDWGASAITRTRPLLSVPTMVSHPSRWRDFPRSASCWGLLMARPRIGDGSDASSRLSAPKSRCTMRGASFGPKVAYLLLLMTTWPSMPGTSLPSKSVMLVSASLGVGSPLGWLCKT